MTRKIVLGICVLIGFLVASAGVATMQMIIGGLIPNNQPDPEGKLDPPVEQQAKKEWQQTQQAAQPSTTTTQPQPQEQQQTQPVQPAPEPVVQPAPPPQRTYQPQPVPATGPGNFDRPDPYYPPVGNTGPGNM